VPFILMLLSFPTHSVVEYGAVGLMVAMMGWMLRNRADESIVQKALPFFAGATILTHAVTTMASFNFTGLELKLAPFCFLLAYGLIFLFKPAVYPNLTKKWPKFVVGALQFMGRYSLYLYAIHVILFMFIALWLNSEKFGLFQWSIFSQ